MSESLIGRAKARLASVRSSSDETADQTVALKQARARVRKLQGEVKGLRADLKEVREELQRTRSSLRDPLVDLPLPERVAEVVAAVRAENLTYLSAPNLAVLARQVHDADLAGRPGLVIETGAALGGSAIAMAVAKDPARPMRVYDVFGMIPEPSERDGEDVHQRYSTIVSGGRRDWAARPTTATATTCTTRSPTRSSATAWTRPTTVSSWCRDSSRTPW